MVAAPVANAKRALEFAWIKGGWDANRDGVAEGVQHNTYDVEFYGPNPLCGVWYLGALRAGRKWRAPWANRIRRRNTAASSNTAGSNGLLLMKGEVLAEGSEWEGSPAQPVLRVEAILSPRPKLRDIW